MGKSPGKWIKGLFSKKTSKSDISKGQVLSKSASERPGRGSSKEPVAAPLLDQPLISGPVSGTIAKESNEILSTITDEKVDRNGKVSKVPDQCLEKDQLDQAVLTLQANIRGHLVRRQAIATLYCVQGIVKFQALARGHMVRKYNAGAAQFRGKSYAAKDVKGPDTSEIAMHAQASRLLKNAFIYKLCGSSPSVMPLRLEYDQGEPNSAWDWLVRWSKLQILAVDSKSKQTCESKNEAVEIESSNNVTNDHEKQNLKLNTENHSTQSSESAVEDGLCENEKDKHDEKLVKPAHEVSIEAELDVEKPVESSTTSKFPEQTSNLVMDNKPVVEDTQKPAPEIDDDVKSGQVDDEHMLGKNAEHMLGKNAISNLSSEVHLADLVSDKPAGDNFNVSNKESKDDQTSTITRKSSRRASLPAKHDEQLTPEITTKVPSYMATTASSKAKAKAQVSPRVGLDRNSLDRRLSLPSSVNVKMSSSPRVHKPVQGTRREGIKIDRSLSLSRDAAGKVMQADWKR